MKIIPTILLLLLISCTNTTEPTNTDKQNIIWCGATTNDVWCDQVLSTFDTTYQKIITIPYIHDDANKALGLYCLVQTGNVLTTGYFKLGLYEILSSGYPSKSPLIEGVFSTTYSDGWEEGNIEINIEGIDFDSIEDNLYNIVIKIKSGVFRKIVALKNPCVYSISIED